MTKDEVRELADSTLRPILGPVGFISSDIDPKRDHAGEESLYVKLRFAPDAKVASGRTYLDAQAAVARALAEHGESRFPYLEYQYVEEPREQDEMQEPDEQVGTWLQP